MLLESHNDKVFDTDVQSEALNGVNSYDGKNLLKMAKNICSSHSTKE